MADLLRTQHRSKMAAHATAAGFAYVRVNATTNIEEGRLPSVEIDTITDVPAKTDNGSWPMQFREHTVRVKFVTRQTGDVGAVLDNLAAGFIARMAGDSTLNGTAKIVRMAEENHERDELDQPIGVLSQIWLIEYRVNHKYPTVAAA